MANLSQSISRVIQAEGGYVDNPNDPGGRTKYGITQSDLETWRLDHADFPSDVADLTTDQATSIYMGSPRWVIPAWNQIGSQWLCDFLVNWGVLRGAKEAVKAFQASEGIDADGVWGVITSKRAAIWIDDYQGDVKFEALSQIIDVIAERPAAIEFAKGWRNRLRNI